MNSTITPEEPQDDEPGSKAVDNVASFLGIPREPNQQDWPYEVADAEHFDRYATAFRHFHESQMDEEKQVLIMMLLQAAEESSILRNERIDLIEKFIGYDIDLYRSIIYHWCVWDNVNEPDDTELSWRITPRMRQIYMNSFEN